MTDLSLLPDRKGMRAFSLTAGLIMLFGYLLVFTGQFLSYVSFGLLYSDEWTMAALIGGGIGALLRGATALPFLLLAIALLAGKKGAFTFISTLFLTLSFAFRTLFYTALFFVTKALTDYLSSIYTQMPSEVRSQYQVFFDMIDQEMVTPKSVTAGTAIFAGAFLFLLICVIIGCLAKPGKKAPELIVFSVITGIAGLVGTVFMFFNYINNISTGLAILSGGSASTGSSLYIASQVIMILSELAFLTGIIFMLLWLNSTSKKQTAPPVSE